MRKRVSKAADVRREELLQAAAALFEDKGVASTAIGDITDRAEVARGTFYLYFSSKDDVVAELWKRYVAGFMSLTDDVLDRPPVNNRGQVVLELLARLAEHALNQAHLHRLIYGTANAPALALCREAEQVILARLTDAVEDYFRSDHREADDAEQMAALLYYGLDGALHNCIMKGAKINHRAFVDGIRRFAASALGIGSTS